MSWTNTNKNSTSFNPIARHGRDVVIGDVESLTFNDPMFADGTLVKDVSFDQLTQQSWTEPNKNTAVFTNINRN